MSTDCITFTAAAGGRAKFAAAGVVLAVFAGAAGPARAQLTAGDVVDRPSLRAFVEQAHAWSEAALAGATEREAYDFFDREFRPEGRWRRGPIYFGVILAEGPDRGVSFFHAVAPELETQNLWDLEDKNGVLITRELIAAAGAGFVEYHFDNPDVTGDEEEGSLKVAWGEELSIAGRKFVLGSGFHPPSAVPAAPPFAWLLLAVLLAAGGAYLRRRGRPQAESA